MRARVVGIQIALRIRQLDGLEFMALKVWKTILFFTLVTAFNANAAIYCGIGLPKAGDLVRTPEGFEAIVDKNGVFKDGRARVRELGDSTSYFIYRLSSLQSSERCKPYVKNP